MRVASWRPDPEDAASHAQQVCATAQINLAHDSMSAAHGVVGRDRGRGSLLTRCEEIQLAARGRDAGWTETNREPR